MTTQPPNRLLVRICGASGAGKSHRVKALVASLGNIESVRIPCDYYLLPAMTPLTTYFADPLQYDWRSLAHDLAAPLGTTIAIPNFDFERFQRRTAAGNKQIVLRRIAVLDALYPYPEAAVRILLYTPESLRAARVAARDEEWRTRVADRWAHLELSKAYLDILPDRYDAILSGADPVAKNVAAVGALIEQRVHNPDSA